MQLCSHLRPLEFESVSAGSLAALFLLLLGPCFKGEGAGDSRGTDCQSPAGGSTG